MTTINKVMTFKSGYFVFSAEYNRDKLSELRVEARLLCETINELPILPEFSSRLESDIIRRSIFGTAGIEGNPLDEEKVGQILKEEDRKVQRDRTEREIKNLQEAYKFLDGTGIDQHPFKLTEDLIKTAHKLITKDINYEDNEPGCYRSTRVEVGDEAHGGVYRPPKAYDDIRMLMAEFVAWINDEKVISADDLSGPYIRAALCHYYLGVIHPFGDGNGRTARLVEAMVLQQAGIRYVPKMLSNYYYRKMDDYYCAFSDTEKAKDYDTTAFLSFVLTGLVESAREIKGKISFYIRVFVLKDYYDFLKKKKSITSRQHKFLKLLLENLESPFTISELFERPAFVVLYDGVSLRTAQRDLKRLIEMKLLKETDKKRYLLNLRTIG